MTETLFIARQDALAQEKNGLSETPMLYSCGLCGKGYRSSKAHAEHLKSRSHILRASQGTSDQEEKAIIRPLPSRVVNKAPPKRQESDEETEESEDEWEEVDSDEDLVGETAKSLTEMNVDEHASNEDMDEDDFEELDPSCCFMCDLEHDTIESCMVHMHKQHGFFIPDIEYLKDPKGLLTYLGLKVLKYLLCSFPGETCSHFGFFFRDWLTLYVLNFQVKRDLLCLYCNDRRHPFNSLEAVRKHMSAKSHCKVHYGDGDDEEEAELEEFYDYSSRLFNFVNGYCVMFFIVSITFLLYVSVSLS